MESNTAQQQAAMQAEPQKQHIWLKKLLGDWTSEAEIVMEPGQSPVTKQGTESVRAIGDLWVVAEGEAEMPDGNPGTMILSLGFDPRTARFVGTWIGSMMTHLWVYDGELDDAERVLTLSSEGPSMAGDDTLSKYRDVIEVVSDDHRTLTSHALGADGKWQKFMTVHYRRKK